MAARRAWVIEVGVLNAALHVTLQGHGDLNRIFMMLPSRKSSRDVQYIIHMLATVLVITLGQQRDDIAARNRDRAMNRIAVGRDRLGIAD